MSPKIPKYIPKPPVPIPKPPTKIPLPPKVNSEDPLAFTRDDLHYIEKEWHMPKAVDLEEAVIGGILVDSKGIKSVIDFLKPKAFYEKAYQLIYDCIIGIYTRDNGGVDLLTVANELKRKGLLEMVGGDITLVQLTQKVASTAHIEFHARIIMQKYILRELIINASNVINEAYNRDPDVFQLMDSLESNILEIYKTSVVRSGDVDEGDAYNELVNKMNKVDKGETSGVYSGVSEFDEWSGGFQKRELITLAARPGMGKTTAVLSIAAKTALESKTPTPTALFTLEMAKTDLKNRLAARKLGIPYSHFRKGTVPKDRLNEIKWYFEYIDESHLYIIEKMNVHEKILAKIRELVLKKGVKLVIIDYVQLMKLARKTSDRTGDLSIITSDLKALANELDIPIVILAQLSRIVDNRPGHRPQLSDLKLSGSIEEDSDTVGFFLRPAYYQEESGMEITDYEKGKSLFIIAKGRSTGTRDFWTFFDFNQFDFRSL